MVQGVQGLDGCAVYLDDVLVFSDTWEEHLERLRALFDRLLWAQLTVNLAKCEFAKATVTYLGKVMGQGEVRTIQDGGQSDPRVFCSNHKKRSCCVSWGWLVIIESSVQILPQWELLWLICSKLISIFSGLASVNRHFTS